MTYKYVFWFWLARLIPQPLRYHVVIMCSADYLCAPGNGHIQAGADRSMDVAKWLEKP